MVQVRKGLRRRVLCRDIFWSAWISAERLPRGDDRTRQAQGGKLKPYESKILVSGASELSINSVERSGGRETSVPAEASPGERNCWAAWGSMGGRLPTMCAGYAERGGSVNHEKRQYRARCELLLQKLQRISSTQSLDSCPIASQL